MTKKDYLQPAISVELLIIIGVNIFIKMNGYAKYAENKRKMFRR